MRAPATQGRSLMKKVCFPIIVLLGFMATAQAASWPAEKQAFVRAVYLNMVEVIYSYEDVPQAEKDKALLDTLTRFRACEAHREYLANTTFGNDYLLNDLVTFRNFTVAYEAALTAKGVIATTEGRHHDKAQYSAWYTEFDALNTRRAKGTETERETADTEWWDFYRICEEVLDGFEKIERDFTQRSNG